MQSLSLLSSTIEDEEPQSLRQSSGAARCTEAGRGDPAPAGGHSHHQVPVRSTPRLRPPRRRRRRQDRS
jgi:hypothetical protein